LNKYINHIQYCEYIILQMYMVDHEEWQSVFPWIDAYINRDFEVDLYKAMEVFESAKTRRADFGQF
jgi:hypothetical protein